ncbi:hypothetical protein GQ600_22311 [Phytophthora cactorum]|nr:hypothetical protein GQ600_22311 [Phytophthora cactorum]
MASSNVVVANVDLQEVDTRRLCWSDVLTTAATHALKTTMQIARISCPSNIQSSGEVHLSRNAFQHLDQTLHLMTIWIGRLHSIRYYNIALHANKISKQTSGCEVPNPLPNWFQNESVCNLCGRRENDPHRTFCNSPRFRSADCLQILEEGVQIVNMYNNQAAVTSYLNWQPLAAPRTSRNRPLAASHRNLLPPGRVGAVSVRKAAPSALLLERSAYKNEATFIKLLNEGGDPTFLIASTFVPSRLPPVGKEKHGKKSGSSGGSVPSSLGLASTPRSPSRRSRHANLAKRRGPGNSTRPRRTSFALQKEKGEESDTCLTPPAGRGIFRASAT